MDAGTARHTKRKQDYNVEIEESVIKNPRVIPSILKGVFAPRKPRVGESFQEILPLPSQSIPTTQPQSEASPVVRPSSATTTEEQISEQQRVKETDQQQE